MILQKSDKLWTLLSIDIVVPLSLEGVDRARVSSADRCGRPPTSGSRASPSENHIAGCDQHV